MLYLTKPSHHDPVSTVDWRSTEATLFEDMCALYNLAREASEKLKTAIDSVLAQKKLNALLRATASAAFYFVEAYLNGLAYDHFIASKNKLDEATTKKLTEWDSSLKKPAYLSLRDKLLQYPRIILGVQHPPLQENNCSELDFISGKAKLLRDSTVHASPNPDRITLEPVKELALFNVSFDEVEKVVDNAILLVREIESTIRGNENSLYWIRERGGSGFFPKIVFR